jgi:hypothetical protein
VALQLDPFQGLTSQPVVTSRLHDFQHPLGSSSHSFIIRLEPALEFTTELGCLQDSGQSTVILELSARTHTLVHSAKNDLLKVLSLTRGKRSTLQATKKSFLDVAGSKEDRIDFEKLDGPFHGLRIMLGKESFLPFQSARKGKSVVVAPEPCVAPDPWAKRRGVFLYALSKLPEVTSPLSKLLEVTFPAHTDSPRTHTMTCPLCTVSRSVGFATTCFPIADEPTTCQALSQHRDRLHTRFLLVAAEGAARLCAHGVL